MMSQPGKSLSLQPPSPVYKAMSRVDDQLPAQRNGIAENDQYNLASWRDEPTKAWHSVPFSPSHQNLANANTNNAVEEATKSNYQPSTPVYDPTLKTSLDEIATQLLEDLKSLTNRIEINDPLLTTIEPVVATHDYYGWNLLENDDGQDAFVLLVNAIRQKGKMMCHRRRHSTNCCFIRKVVLRCFAAPDIQTMIEAIASIPTVEELVITDELEDNTTNNNSASSIKANVSRKRRRRSTGSITSNGCQFINIACLTDLLISSRRKDESDSQNDDNNNNNDDGRKSMNVNRMESNQQQLPRDGKTQGQILIQHGGEATLQAEPNSETATSMSPINVSGWKVLDIGVRIHVRNIQEINRFAVDGIYKNIHSLQYINLNFLPRCSISTPTINFNELIKVLASPSVSKRQLTHIEIKLGYNHNPYGCSMVSISSLEQLLLSTSSWNSDLRSLILQNVGISADHVRMIARLIQIKKHKQSSYNVKEDALCKHREIIDDNCIDGIESYYSSKSALRKLQIVGSSTSSFTNSSLQELCKSLQSIVEKKLQLLDPDEDDRNCTLNTMPIDHDSSSFIFDQLEHLRFGTIEQIQNIRRSLAFNSFDDDDATDKYVPKTKRSKIITDSDITDSTGSSSIIINTTEPHFYLFHQQIQHSMRLLRVLNYIVNRKQQQQHLNKRQINTTDLLFRALCFTNKNLISNSHRITSDACDDNDDDDDDIGGESVISVLFDLIRHNPAMLIL